MTPADAAPYAAAFRDDPGLGPLLGVERDPDEQTIRESLEAEAQRIHDLRFVKRAIADPVTDAFRGEVLVHSLHGQHRRGEVGFWQRHSPGSAPFTARGSRLVQGQATFPPAQSSQRKSAGGKD